LSLITNVKFLYVGLDWSKVGLSAVLSRTGTMKFATH
jgi:hypothetical protein